MVRLHDHVQMSLNVMKNDLRCRLYERHTPQIMISTGQLSFASLLCFPDRKRCTSERGDAKNTPLTRMKWTHDQGRYKAASTSSRIGKRLQGYLQPMSSSQLFDSYRSDPGSYLTHKRCMADNATALRCVRYRLVQQWIPETVGQDLGEEREIVCEDALA